MPATKRLEPCTFQSMDKIAPISDTSISFFSPPLKLPSLSLSLSQNNRMELHSHPLSFSFSQTTLMEPNTGLHIYQGKIEASINRQWPGHTNTRSIFSLLLSAATCGGFNDSNILKSITTVNFVD